MAKECSSKGWELHPHPYRDDNRSASRYSSKVREGYLRLVSDIRAGNFDADVLGLWEASRGSRRTSEWLEIIEVCKDQGILIWVLTHGRVYDPTNARDRRSIREDASDAEYESDKTSQRILRHSRDNAEKGRPHGKQIYGYRRVYDAETRRLIEVVAHPDQAPVVQEAAHRALSGESFYAIAKDFNTRGIPPRRSAYREQRKYLGWTGPAVKQMLTMPAYAGKRQHRGEIIGDAIWPPLLEPETWDRLQRVISPPDRRRTNDWPVAHLLGGIAVCGICGVGTRITKQNSGRKRYDDQGNALPRARYNIYICSGAPGKTGFHVAMKEEHLDKVVVDVVLARLERPDFLAMLGQTDDSVDAEREALIKEIADHQAWLNEVQFEAERRRDLRWLDRQEEIVLPKMKAAQDRLDALVGVDPVIVELVRSGRIREIWSEHEAAGDFAWRRKVLRALVVPQINRVKPDELGSRGINRDRVDFLWR